MIYGCFLEKNEEDRCFTDYFGIKRHYRNFFYTTESKIENVKKKLKEKFCEKHKMGAFTKEEFDKNNEVADALKDIDRSKKKFSDRAEYTFEYISGLINEIELEDIEEKEYNYGSGSTPTEWYCIYYDSNSDEENTIVYVPSKEYFKSKESWEDFVNKMTGKDALGYTRKLKGIPTACKKIDYNGDDYDGGRILNKELNPTGIFVFDKDVLNKIAYGSSSSSSSSSRRNDDSDSSSEKEKKKEEKKEQETTGGQPVEGQIPKVGVIVNPHITDTKTRNISEKKGKHNGSSSSSSGYDDSDIISSRSSSRSRSRSSGYDDSDISSSSSSSEEEEAKKKAEEEKKEKELVLNSKKIENIRIVQDALNLKPDDRRYVISKNGEELIIYPILRGTPEKIVKILTKIKATGNGASNSTQLSEFIKKYGYEALKEIKKSSTHVKSWKQFKSTPAYIFGTHVNFDYCNDINGKKATNSMNYGEIIKLYTETSDTKAADEEERKKCREEEKKGKKLSTKDIIQIMDEMIKFIDDIDRGKNFLKIVLKLIPAKATEYRQEMTRIKNFFDNLEEFNFSDKENINIKSLQKIVEEKLKIDKSSKYGRTAYGIVLIATALAYYDYCLLKDSNVKIALGIITDDLLKTIKNLDRTGLRNTTIAKKKCLNKLEEMLNKIQTESKKMSDEIKTKLKEMSEQSKTTSEE